MSKFLPINMYIIITASANTADSAQVGCRLSVNCYQFSTTSLANTYCTYLPTNTYIPVSLCISVASHNSVNNVEVYRNVDNNYSQ